MSYSKKIFSQKILFQRHSLDQTGMTVLARTKVPTPGPQSLPIMNKPPISTSFQPTQRKSFTDAMAMTSSKGKVATTSSMAVQTKAVQLKMATTSSMVVRETIKLMVAQTMINSLVTTEMTHSPVGTATTPSMEAREPTSSMVNPETTPIN